MIKKFTYLLVLSLWLIQLQSQEASAVLKDKQIKIGDQTTIELELRVQADGKSVMFPALVDTISKQLEIVDISEIDTAYDENDISIRILTQTITITSWDSGFHAIPPFQFKVDGKEVYTKADLLEVSTVPLEAEADIKDIKDIMQVPFSLWDWILVHKYWILSIVLIILGIALLIWVIKKARQQSPQPEVFIPKEEADVIALRQLKELEAKKLWQGGKVNQYYTQLSHILREYLENRFQISALEKTTDEIDMLLKYHKEVEERNQQQFKEYMELADLAKFAKQEPLASENEAALKYAYRFVEETKLEINSADSEKEEEADEISKPIKKQPEENA